MLTLGAVFLAVSLVRADPPPQPVSLANSALNPVLVNYQGLLTDADGNPLPDGEYAVTFALYDMVTGGAPLWMETQTVTTRNGLFNVQLGSVTQLESEPIDGRDLWLEVQVESDPPMTPRIAINSVFYARSLKAGAVVSGDIYDAPIILVRNEGRMGTGIKIETIGDGKALDARGPVEVERYITAEGDVRSRSNLFADRNMEAGGDVKARGNIEAGGDLICGGQLQCEVPSLPGDVIAGGTAGAYIQTASFGQRVTYAVGGSQVWLVDQGQGQLKQGVATVTLDPIFAEMVTIDDQHPTLVQITLTGEAKGVYVTDKTAYGFTVRELQGGTSNATFDWQVSALRKGYEETRLEIFQEE
jgi:hypothetical protein